LAGERDHEQSHRVEVADAGIAYVQGEGGFPVQQDSPAVAVARAHIEAWSRIQDPPASMTTGGPPFGEAVVPGSARVIASVGDETNALLMVSVKAAFAPGAPQLTLPAARL